MDVGDTFDEIIFYMDKVACKNNFKNQNELTFLCPSAKNFLTSTEKKKRIINSEGDCATTTCKTVKGNDIKSLNLNMSEFSESSDTVYTIH